MNITATFANNLLADKTVYIAGGTSGINLGIAQAMGELGARLFLVGRDQQRLDAAVSGLKDKGIYASGKTADVKDFEAVYRSVEACHASYGDIDIAISGAAGNFVSPANQLTANGFKTVVDIDLNGTFNVCRSVHDFANPAGASIINISAVQAFTPMAGQAHVCAAKAGIESLTRVLAIEWGPKNIRVNAIAPGAVDNTEGMNRLTPTEAHRKKYMSNIPIGRYASIEEVAGAAVYLCSPLGENFAGEVIVCDGGQSILGGKGFQEAWS